MAISGWTPSAKRAAAQVENIRDGSTAANPAGEAEYAAAYIAQLQTLNQEIAQQPDQTYS
ncbi:MAG: hypothetical protein ACFB5Z_10925 [Elainellaceae cyanobacterium]